VVHQFEIRSHRVAPLRSNAAYRGAGRALDTRRFAALLGPNGVPEFKLMHYPPMVTVARSRKPG
ncbi:MAG: hypothetical protein ACT4QA_09510, partial [Panacagrimonas sp.]